MKKILFSLAVFNVLVQLVPTNGYCQSTKSVNAPQQVVPVGNIILTEATTLFTTKPSRVLVLNYSTVTGGIYNYTPVALSQPTSLSGTARVEGMPSTELEIVVFPNPNKGVFSIKGMVANEQSVKIFVTNMAGQIVYQTTTIAIEGHINSQVQLPANVAPGQYNLQVIGGNQQSMHRVVVEY